MRPEPQRLRYEGHVWFWRVYISVGLEQIHRCRSQVQVAAVAPQTLTRDHSHSFRNRADYGTEISILLDVVPPIGLVI
jgi:hypothetical protein